MQYRCIARNGRGCGDYSCRICYVPIRTPRSAQRTVAAIATNRTAYNAAVPAESRVWLTVPFAEKDLAKRLGARWDNDRRQWYADARESIAPFRTWGAKPTTPVAPPVAPPVPTRKALFAERVAPPVPVPVPVAAPVPTPPRKAPVVPSMAQLIDESAVAAPVAYTTDDLFAAIAHADGAAPVARGAVAQSTTLTVAPMPARRV